MNRPVLLSIPAILGGLVALSTPGSAFAQAATANGGGRPRTTDNRATTESATPPPVNSDYRKAAEGTLPVAPGTNVLAPSAPGAGGGAIAPGAGRGPGGAVDPATPLFPGRVRDGQGDPAAGLQPGARNLEIERVGLRPGGMPAGIDVAMMVEHALGMSIEASALKSIGEQDLTDDASKMLVDQAKQEMERSKAVLARAAADGSAVPAGSPARKFYAAANAYMTTLGQLCSASSPTATDRAQTAMVNAAVKHALDADHIQQFGRMYAGSPAADQMLEHAGMMKQGGMEMLDKVAGDATADASGPATPLLLARRGKDLLAAAGEVAAMTPAIGSARGGVPLSGPGAAAGSFAPADPNPARLRDTRPEIIGGTTATGSPTTGTYTGPEAAAAVKNAKELPNGQLIVPNASDRPGAPVSNYGEGNNITPPTNSSAGSRPR